jgi:hypothetical protein
MKKMNKKTIELLNQINSIRAKIYYNLKSLEKMTTLKPRALKYRMKLIKEKYKGRDFLLNKKGKEWNIHYSLINEFLPKYKSKLSNVYSENWRTEFSWNSRSNYNKDQHIQLLNELKLELNDFKIGYSLERDSRGIYHVHGLAYASKEKVKEAFKRVISKYLLSNEFRIHTSDLLNKYSYIEYMRKLGEIKFI